jgi:hypothetical protein
MYPTESKAMAALQPMLIKINGEAAFVEKHQATFGTLIQRFIESEKLNELKAMPPGDAFVTRGSQRKFEEHLSWVGFGLESLRCRATNIDRPPISRACVRR